MHDFNGDIQSDRVAPKRQQRHQQLCHCIRKFMSSCLLYIQPTYNTVVQFHDRTDACNDFLPLHFIVHVLFCNDYSCEISVSVCWCLLVAYFRRLGNKAMIQSSTALDWIICMCRLHKLLAARIRRKP